GTVSVRPEPRPDMGPPGRRLGQRALQPVRPPHRRSRGGDHARDLRGGPWAARRGRGMAAARRLEGQAVGEPAPRKRGGVHAGRRDAPLVRRRALAVALTRLGDRSVIEVAARTRAWAASSHARRPSQPGDGDSHGACRTRPELHPNQENHRMFSRRRSIPVLTLLTVPVAACGDDDPIAPIEPGEPDTQEAVLSGTIEGDRELSADTTYYIQGVVTVEDGATLTIPAGTLLLGDV